MYYLCLIVSTLLVAESSSQKVNAAFIFRRMINESYDIHERPPSSAGNDTQGPVDVILNLLIRSLSNFDPVSMNYDVQITIREEWKDTRLAYDNIPGELPKVIVINDKDAIWRPDTFFLNEKRAYRHEVNTPNVLIRIYPDGKILFSQRLTLTVTCLMNFAMFPLDVHRCSLEMASYAHSTNDLVYKWKNDDPVQMKYGIEESLPTFTFEKFNHSYCTSKTKTGDYSCLRVTFTLARQLIYYIVQVYIPSTLLVIVSWVSFWLDRSAVPARVTLGVTTLLAMTIQAAVINNKLPPVSYIKAIDVWIFVCLIFIFGSILEHVWVTYVANQNEQREKKHRCCSNGKSMEVSPMNTSGSVKREKENLLYCSRSISNIDGLLSDSHDKATTIDISCRIYFPLAFITFNVVHWVYMYSKME